MSSIDFEEKIENKMGFGKAQKYGIASCAILEVAEGAELMIMGFLIPIL